MVGHGHDGEGDRADPASAATTRPAPTFSPPSAGRRTIPGFEAGALLMLWLAASLRDGDLATAMSYADVGPAYRRRLRASPRRAPPRRVLHRRTHRGPGRRRGPRPRGIEVVNGSLARLGEASPRTRIFGHQLLAETEHTLQNGAEARRHARRSRPHPPPTPALDAELQPRTSGSPTSWPRARPGRASPSRRSPQPNGGCCRSSPHTSRCRRSPRSST